MGSFCIFGVFVIAPLVPTQVQSRYVDFASCRSALPEMRPLELRALRRAEQPAATRDRLQDVLRQEERVVLAQPRALALDIAGVRRVEIGDGSADLRGRVTGDRNRMVAGGRGGIPRYEFTGQIDGGLIKGTLALGEGASGKQVPWTAKQVQRGELKRASDEPPPFQ